MPNATPAEAANIAKTFLDSGMTTLEVLALLRKGYGLTRTAANEAVDANK